MRYSYRDKNGRILAEADSPISFNTELFPIFKDIEPVVSERKSKATGNKKSEEIEE